MRSKILKNEGNIETMIINFRDITYDTGHYNSLGYIPCVIDNLHRYYV